MRMFADWTLDSSEHGFASSTRRAKLCGEGLWTPIRKWLPRRCFGGVVSLRR